MATKTKALVKWDAKLAEMAKAAASHVDVGGGNFLSIKSGRLSYKNAQVPGSKLKAIVLAFCYENSWTKAKYNPDKPESPDCFAFGTSKDEMAPHADSTLPQEENCADCSKNEFGSADTGKGKACSNRYRLALITEAGMDDLESAEVAYLRVPPTSLKAWAGYVKQLEEAYNIPPFAAITEITVEPDAKTQVSVTFSLVEKIEDGEAIGALIEKAEKAEKDIAFPYVKIQATDEPKKSASKGVSIRKKKF
jgi:hypothetical protein